MTHSLNYLNSFTEYTVTHLIVHTIRRTSQIPGGLGTSQGSPREAEGSGRGEGSLGTFAPATGSRMGRRRLLDGWIRRT